MKDKQMPQPQNDKVTPVTLECYGNTDEHYSYKCSTQYKGDFARLCVKATLRKKIESWPFLKGFISSNISENDYCNDNAISEGLFGEVVVIF